MSIRVMAALNIALLSGIVSFTWAARPDGEPTCTFKGGAFYASENVMYLESLSEEGSEIAVSSEDVNCVNNHRKGDYKLIVERNTALPANSTILLPASFGLNSSVDNGCIHLYEPNRIGKDSTGEWDIVAKNLIGDGASNKPYLMITDVETEGCGDIKEIEFVGRDFAVTEQAKTELTMSSAVAENSDWTMEGTYSYVSWKEGDKDLGRVFGYAAKSKGRYNAGQFVKAGAGAYIPPMRAYLRYNGQAPLTKSASEEAFELPKTINVRLVDGDGETTRLVKWNTVTGEIKMEGRQYDLNGRRVNAKHAAKGMYVNKIKVER